MPKVPVLETYIPFLVNRAAIESLTYSDAHMAEWGITVPKWRILFALLTHEPLRIGRLAALTSIEGGTLTRLLNELETARYLRRTQVPADTRAYDVTLTERGRRLANEIMPFAQTTEQLALEGVSKADVAVLRRVLITMYENLVRARSRQKAALLPRRTRGRLLASGGRS